MSNGNGSRSMAFRDLEIGDVVLIRLPRHRPHGFEQEGIRPGVIVGVPTMLGTPRFPVLVIAPFTTDRTATWSQRNSLLYPRLHSGSGNLSADSVCLLDQVRAIDISRITRRWGRLSSSEFAPIQDGLMRMFGLATAD